MLDKKTLDIVEDAISGDEKAFVKLCEIKGRDILYIAAHLMGNVSDGEDAAQEVLIYMYKNLHKLKDPKAFQAWLFRVMRGICVDLKRKNKRKRLLFHEKPRDTETREARMDFLPYEFYEDNSKKDSVLEIINKLPQVSKLCVLFFYYENMSYEEIAYALSISKKEVDNNLVKARKLIRKKLGAEKYTKDFLSKLFVVSTTPYISQILLYEAKQMIGDRALSHLLEASKEIVSGSLISGAAAKGLTGTGSSGSSTAGITAKITLGVVTTVSAATIGTAMYQNNKEPAESEVQMEETVPEITETEEPEEVVSIVTEPEQQILIQTLEDMLGESEAEMLKAYSVSDEISSEELSEYIGAIGLESEETYWWANIEQRDILYVLEKQDKLLMVIVREVASEITGVAFRFTDSSEQLPRSYDIEFCYEEWRE